MLKEFPFLKNVVVVAPHPDDEALGCGGTILELTRRGSRSAVAYVTDGESLYGEPSSDIARQRREEARQAAALLGCAEALFFSLPDGRVAQDSAALLAVLRETVIERGAGLILSPSPADYHEDHRAAGRAALRLMSEVPGLTLAFYEIYETVRFNALVDISALVEEKARVISSYATSLFGKPDVYVHAALGLNAHRSIFVQRKGHFEAFLVIDSPMDEKEVLQWLAYEKD